MTEFISRKELPLGNAPVSCGGGLRIGEEELGKPQQRSKRHKERHE